ncbi:uncharacterized protein METZ01_LOCUS47224 [marine metagenome]|uniref:Uncharacterized protein n=1 Tax=marine metagenome TaxID=408172 RepID=A0A381RR66_9ZZZZ
MTDDLLVWSFLPAIPHIWRKLGITMG